MSKFLWVVSKNNLSNDTNSKILSICEELVPDNITVENHLIQVSEKVAFGVSNPKNNIIIQKNSLLVGTFFGDFPKWHIPQSEFPDGSFALFRESESLAEVVADPAASRTIWYYFDEEKLLASTSQLAIVRFLGNFEFNPTAAAWMLSSGTLGPTDSWDKRLKRIQPDSSIILERDLWEIKERKTKIEFTSGNENDEFYEKKLKNSIHNIFSTLNINPKNWVLPLSGGYDSRSLLFYLTTTKKLKIKTITWGLKRALGDSKSDASIAKELSKAASVENKYFFTDFSNEDLETLISKFIKNGEGRIDAISGYLDGFKLWEELHNENIQGIIRGDVGWAPTYEVISYSSARMAVNLKLLKDFNNIKVNQIFFSEVNQEIPSEIEILPGEEYELWRDRLYHNFRIPTILAALSDLKLGYLDEVNPLLSREILMQIREHPIQLRRKKYLFKKIVKSMYPSVPFANKSAQESVKGFVNSLPLNEYLKNELEKHKINPIFSGLIIENTIRNLRLPKKTKLNSSSTSIKSLFLNLIPNWIKIKGKKKLLKNKKFEKLELDNNLLAFRIILTLKSYELFNKK
jgi:hypothetical protein